MLRLADGVHGTVVNGTPIVLDTSKPRYFLLRGPTAASFRALSDGRPTLADLDQLIAAGIVQSPGDVGFEPSPPRPNMSCEDRPGTSPGFRIVLDAFRTQVAAKRMVQRHGMLGALNFLRDRTSALPSPTRRTRNITESEIGAAFARTRLVLPSLDQCLARSAALASVLTHHGHDVRLVIGVQLPFAAHCWVQSGEQVIGDPLDRVRAFQPILVA